jgi:broad specificity phosphatase PhoE
LNWAFGTRNGQEREQTSISTHETALASIYAGMILIRHGQSEFNLHFSATRIDPGIPDPKLTPLGEAQAEAAAETLAGAGITRIIASPYTRAMQTAAPFARRLGLPVTISPLVRERYHFVCDIGTPVSALRAQWPEHDFGDLPETWWPAETETEAAALVRALAFQTAMAAQPDHAETLVVTHWAFIRAMTGLSLGNGEWIVVNPAERPASGLLQR